MRILGIESSCDECSASIVSFRPAQGEIPRQLRVESLSTFSQIKIHQPYGGVVPEIASRNHLETVNEMIDRAFLDAGLSPSDPSSIDAIAVTNRPGLVGSLLVGVSAAKALAYALKKPLVPVHHLEGHAASVYLQSSSSQKTLVEGALPGLLAVVSGGHSNLYKMNETPEFWPTDFLKSALVGRSRDDAAGEAFDKVAKLLGFPYPGGMWIDQNAKGGDPTAFPFPRAMAQKSTFDLSFSGLKTAAALAIQKLKKENQLEARMKDLCASIQEAILDTLLNKVFLAVETYKCESLAIVGGVAANSRLREKVESEWQRLGLKGHPTYPHLSFCTDNAAMIAAAGAFRFFQGHALSQRDLLTLNARASSEF